MRKSRSMNVSGESCHTYQVSKTDFLVTFVRSLLEDCVCNSYGPVYVAPLEAHHWNTCRRNAHLSCCRPILVRRTTGSFPEGAENNEGVRIGRTCRL